MLLEALGQQPGIDIEKFASQARVHELQTTREIRQRALWPDPNHEAAVSNPLPGRSMLHRYMPQHFTTYGQALR